MIVLPLHPHRSLVEHNVVGMLENVAWYLRYLDSLKHVSVFVWLGQNLLDHRFNIRF